MKLISKVEKMILSMNDNDLYTPYMCAEHVIFQIRKDRPEQEHCCLYCKKKYEELTNEQIVKLNL